MVDRPPRWREKRGIRQLILSRKRMERAFGSQLEHIMTLEILRDEYGVSVGIFDPLAIAWAAESAAFQFGAEAVKVEIRKINRWRGKRQLPPVCFPFGHELF